MFAEKRVNPLKICNLGFSEKVKFFLKKINIKGSVQKTVKKYLAHVIWRTSIEELKYLANASITGTIIQAVAFKIIAFVKEGYLLIEVF